MRTRHFIRLNEDFKVKSMNSGFSKANVNFCPKCNNLLDQKGICYTCKKKEEGE